MYLSLSTQSTRALPAALSPSYIADSDPEEDPEEDPKEDHVTYPIDGGDDDDESSDYYDDDVEEDEDDEEEERLAPGNSCAIPIRDPVPSTEDTEAFTNDESAPTPPSPRPLRARISVKLLPLMRASMEAHIIKYAFAATPPSPPPSLLSPWSSPLPQIPSPLLPLPLPPTSPTYAEEPLGYRAAMI
ncbi:hypothetical protein Tco_1207490 [Tanacetum coccineum]